MNGHELDTLDGRVPLCPEGTVIKGRWRVAYQIGMGAFGEIYVARNVNTQERVAIKVEVADEKKQALRAEVAIMRRLQGCPYVCQFISCGRQNNINFVVMELLGSNLSDMRKKQPRGCFSMATVCRLGCEMIEALQAVHGMGVLHRDVKPSNFVLGGRYLAHGDPAAANRLYIIDFGLSRKYLGQDGEIKPPRANAGFRGTARYASVNSHDGKELAPRDDLWSVLYMLIEFATGSLPWRAERDRDKVGEMKKKYMGGKKLVRGLPSEFEEFMAYLLTLDYYSKPDYALLIGLFRGLLLRIMGLPPSMLDPGAHFKPPPYDWEKPAAAGAEGSAGTGGAATTVSSTTKDRFMFFRKKLKPHNEPVGSAAAPAGAGTTLQDDAPESPHSRAPPDFVDATDTDESHPKHPEGAADHAAAPEHAAAAEHAPRDGSGEQGDDEHSADAHHHHHHHGDSGADAAAGAEHAPEARRAPVAAAPRSGCKGCCIVM